MTTTTRFARAALLLGGSAAVAGTLAILSTPSQVAADVPALPALPWAAVAGAPAPLPPAAILYASERCAHCAPAARAASAEAAAAGVTLVVVAHGSADSTRRYAARLSLRSPVAADTSGALGRALGVRNVPALFLFARDGSRSVLVGFRDARAYARALRTLR